MGKKRSAKKEGDFLQEGEIDTFAKDDLVCPFCGWQHDPDDLGVRKKSSGFIRCVDCGETFSFESTKKVVYTTYQE